MIVSFLLEFQFMKGIIKVQKYHRRYFQEQSASVPNWIKYLEFIKLATCEVDIVIRLIFGTHCNYFFAFGLFVRIIDQTLYQFIYRTSYLGSFPLLKARVWLHPFRAGTPEPPPHPLEHWGATHDKLMNPN